MAGMLRALQELPCLAQLAINNVDFDNEAPSYLYSLSPALRRLEFSDLAYGLYLFFDAVFLQETIDTMHITRCNVDHVDWENVSCTELILGEIDARYDIGQILDHFEIVHLHVHECPSFHDDLLYSLMGSTPLSPHEDVSARTLCLLSISRCNNFSMGAL
ncbi:hypothetical protein PAXINDRAFT_172754, partial [Paxillus involutus ATCC 200175]